MAPRQISGAPVSIAGEAFITLPPMVPLARVACDPTMADASARPVKRSRTTGCDSSSSCVTSAPSRSPPPAAEMPRSASMPWMRDERVGQRRLALPGADHEVGAAGDRAGAAGERLDGLARRVVAAT